MRSRVIIPAIAALAFLTVSLAAQAAEISIVAPTSQETVFSNQGKLTVKLRATDRPPAAGVRLVLDGKARAKIYHGNVIKLDGIDRGSHSVQAVLVSADGDRLAVSTPVTFYMWHASRLFPDRK